MVNETDIATIKGLEGGARLVAIAKMIGDPESDFEITQLNELGELEQFRRFIYDTKSAWNALRKFPLDLITTAYITDIKSAYAALQTLCDGSEEWSGDNNAPIEGLTFQGALPLIHSCDFVGHDMTLAGIPKLITENRTELLAKHIKGIASALCATRNIKLSDLYYASFAVDVRSIETREQFFFAIPFFLLAAMTTIDEELPDGLDRVAARNRYSCWTELQKDLGLRFGIAPQSWVEAAEVVNMDIASDRHCSVMMSMLRRLVKRRKLELLSQRIKIEQ